MTDPSTGPDEREHTLPSGLTVTVRSHRVLRRADIHRVWAAGNTAAPGMSSAAQNDALMGLLVASTSDPEKYPVPLTTEALDRLTEHDNRDYFALYRLMGNGYRLVNGLSVIPDPDEYEDPKAPTAESNGSAPGSADTTSSPSTATTGTTSTTTSTSTAPEDGPPQP